MVYVYSTGHTSTNKKSAVPLYGVPQQMGHVKAPQRLLTHTFSAKALAVKRVIENHDNRTAVAVYDKSDDVREPLPIMLHPAVIPWQRSARNVAYVAITSGVKHCQICHGSRGFVQAMLSPLL